MKLTEDANMIETLAHGFGATEGKAIRLVIGEFCANFTATLRQLVCLSRRSSVPSSSS